MGRRAARLRLRRWPLDSVASSSEWTPVADVDPFWALLAARASAGAVVVTMVVAARPPLRGPADLPSLALIGVLDVGANARFALGADTGLLSVVSVLASLYRC